MTPAPRDECERAWARYIDFAHINSAGSVPPTWFKWVWHAALERVEPVFEAARAVAATLEPDETGGVYGPSYQQVKTLAAAIRALEGGDEQG